MERETCQRIFSQVVDAARALGVTEIEVLLAGGEEALTRFANNAIHQNVAARDVNLSVRPVTDGRTARATTNRLDAEGIRNVVAEAVAITRLTAPDPDLQPLARPAECQPAERCFEATAQVTPRERALAVAEAIRRVEGAGQTAAGIYSTGDSFFAALNSRGLSAWHRETMARFSITAMASGSSGWAKASACYHGDLDPVQLAAAASGKAAASQAPRELPPGRYTVILEPAAVLDLAGQMFGDFSATAIRDGRSFLNDRIGRKVFGGNIDILDDAHHPLQSGPPFDGEGVPTRRTVVVENGVLKSYLLNTYAAKKLGLMTTGNASRGLAGNPGIGSGNFFLEPGAKTPRQIIADVKEGLYVTEFLGFGVNLVTGDFSRGAGGLWIVNGELTYPVEEITVAGNLKEMLRNISEIGNDLEFRGSVACPTMRIDGMTVAGE